MGSREVALGEPHEVIKSQSDGIFNSSATVNGVDSKLVAAGKGSEPVQQPKQQQHAAQEESVRTLRVHLSRPAVSRGMLHHLAKVFGVHLQGAVATNEVSTAKYTILTFLPVNLFEQFLRIANLYFLLMAILQLIPGLSPTSWFTTVAPLVFVLAVNAIKEGYDDVHRHRNDNQVNNRQVILLSSDPPSAHSLHSSEGGSRKEQGLKLEDGQQLITWRDVIAGDLIMVRADEEVPADLLLLSANDPDDLCYVETANLDGETNLKIKYCWSGYTYQEDEFGHKPAPKQHVDDFREMADKCIIGYEKPNAKLYKFEGYVEDDVGKRPLTIDNLLLRGSVLRKTEWVVGVALNVGAESKIVKNMTKAPRKVTQLEKAMNVLVLVQFANLIIFSAVLAGLDQWWSAQNTVTEPNTAFPRLWYLLSQNKYPELPPGVASFFITFLRFLILLSNMIPISLYVSLEVVKVFQCALLFNQDRKMYHAESDTPFVCRTTTLNEELGQVQYVLSDKTGTLTQNIMGFVWASIGGTLYGQQPSDEEPLSGVPAKTPHTIAFDTGIQKALGLVGPHKDKAVAKLVDPHVNAFFTALAVCNVVVPSANPVQGGPLLYQASSPDEEALVQGSAYLGHVLISRTTEQVKLEVDNNWYTYDILATLEFNSDRKRMSIIVRTPQDKLMLYCKGADNVILARLKDGEQQPGVQTAKEHLEEMSRAGYRTLLVAQRELSRKEYEQWQESYAAASVAMTNREQLMAQEQDRIERDLVLLGATAVEDKLQDGVPDCLQALAKAGIKVWVLTGDKVETAISIAYSCKLFTDDMAVLEFREREFEEARTVDEKRQVMESKLAQVRQYNAVKHSGIVIEGGALNTALDPELQDTLMALCKECKAVVCCRVSPMQKAQITNMVKKKAGAITLGIGDGANDVGMIRAAHIGVGISGREGRAAVLSSDFSFAQFQYLSRLLLLHGRWSFLRNREVVLYSFYKNWAYVMVYIYLQFVAGYSAVPVFTTMLISTFNMIFTACPIVAYAVLEQDLRIDTVLANPETYDATRTATQGNFYWLFVLWIIAGTWHSLPVYFLPWYTLTTPDSSGQVQDLSGTGTAVFVALTFAVTFKLCLRTHAWSWITHLVYWLSLAVLFPFIYVISILWPNTSVSGVADMSGTAPWLFASPVFWLTALAGAPAIALLPDVAVMLFKRQVSPNIVELLQEHELVQQTAYEQQQAQQQKAAGTFITMKQGQAHDEEAAGMASNPIPVEMGPPGSPHSYTKRG